MKKYLLVVTDDEMRRLKIASANRGTSMKRFILDAVAAEEIKNKNEGK